VKPRYPVYIPTKGRAGVPLTGKMFDRDSVPYKMVVEPAEREAYTKAGYGDKLLILPENGRGLVYARNWIKDYSISQGEARHWQFDDDIIRITRLYKGYRFRVPSGTALAACEDFADRYENVALVSINSEFFVPVTAGLERIKVPPFYLNGRCYTVFLVDNTMVGRWRQKYNEDTDMSLQVLSRGHCTILMNAFLIKTPETMTDKGGQTAIYINDGRLKMARQLERVWPGVVVTKRRFGRPQHAIKSQWKKFDTPLKLKPGIDLANMKPNDYGLELKAVKDVKSASVREFLAKDKK
jgi:hypothetical protein